jgi:hypothetical protein
MRRAFILGSVLFLGILVVRAPAGLLPRLIPAEAPVALLSTSGTLWQGRGILLVEGATIGDLHWSFRPVTLLTGEIAYDVALSGEHIDLGGRAATGLRNTSAAASGTIGAPFVNRWLAPYDIRLDGLFRVDDIRVTMSGQRVNGIAGKLEWNGGPVTYYLSGKLFNSTLPPMRAELGPGPEAIAFAEGDSTPLLMAELQSNGFAKIGVTKYLTKLLGNPWPGGDPDHAVVLEVEEQVF